jgi:hypothetical protein
LQAAAEQKLRAIVLPLDGVIAKSASDFHWLVGGTHCSSPIMPDGSLDEIFAVGDRVYLQEEWAKEDQLYVSNSEDPNDDYHWFGEAGDMPPEAAQYWFEVREVEVVPMDKIDCPLAYDAGLTDSVFESFPPQPIPGVTFEQSCKNWDKAYPEQPWHSDRWVIVLAVEAIANS